MLGLRKVIDPEKGAVPEVYRMQEHVIKRNEYGQLYEQRETASQTAQGVDAVTRIKLHELRILLGFVVLEFLFERVHLGLDFFHLDLHLLHGNHALDGKGKENQPHDQRDHDDGNAVIMDITVEPFEEIEEGFCKKLDPAVVNRFLEIIADGFYRIILERPEINLPVLYGGLSRRDRVSRIAVEHLHESFIPDRAQCDRRIRPRFGKEARYEVLLGVTEPVDDTIVAAGFFGFLLHHFDVAGYERDEAHRIPAPAVLLHLAEPLDIEFLLKGSRPRIGHFEPLL